MYTSHQVFYAHVVVCVCVLAATVFIVVRGNHPNYNQSSADNNPVFTVATVATDVSMYATFQSHNEKVLQNQYGIFITYLAKDNPDGTSTWRLARSADGGASFATVYEDSSVATRTPPIASSGSGSIYLAYNDYGATHQGYILRFDPATNFKTPTQLAVLPDAAHGKFAMVIDESRQQIYYANSTGYGMKFFVVGFDGAVRKNVQLLTEGEHAGSHYPNLYVDEYNDLYLAWTTAAKAPCDAPPCYYSIHVLRSTNGGSTWLTNGSTPVSLPVVSDDTGPATQISVVSDPNPWLSNFIVKNHVGQFMYGLYNYVRYNFTTGRLEDRNTTAWFGNTVKFFIFDGLITSKKGDSSAPLYAVSRTAQNRIGVRVSKDQGKTWQDFAQSDSVSNPYGIGGSRTITADNKLIGTYTELGPNNTHNKMKFFSVSLPVSQVLPPPPLPGLTVTWGTKGDIPVPGDYDGDGKTDTAVWRPSTGVWWIVRSSDGANFTQQWGSSGDIPVPADYDGDHKTDMAVWRPAGGTWWVMNSAAKNKVSKQWGFTGDVPTPGDYDGDGKADFAIWRPSTRVFWITNSSDDKNYTKQWGVPGDIPATGDFDGDGKTDMAIWRPSTGTWWVVQSSDRTTITKQWGYVGDVPTPKDFDGDHKTDFAIWRPSSGTWWIVNSSDGKSYTKQWGTSGDVPVAGDYDGDGKAEAIVWRPSEGKWSIK